MADEQKDDAQATEAFSSQNQQNDEQSGGNESGDNAETSPGSYRQREDEDEEEGEQGFVDSSGEYQPGIDVQMVEDLQSEGDSLTDEQSVGQFSSELIAQDGEGSSELGEYDGAQSIAHDEDDPSLMDFNGKSSVVAPVDDGGYMCKECGAWYKLRQSLNSHIQDQHQGKRFKCSKCSYSTNRRHDLYRHDGQVHKTGKSGLPRSKSNAPNFSTVAAALKQRNERRLAVAKAAAATGETSTPEAPTSAEGSNKGKGGSNSSGSGKQQAVIVSDGMQGAVFSGSSSPQGSTSWVEDHVRKPHRQTESFEHQLPSGAIFRRITEITFFPDGRIRETRTEEYEMP